MQYSLCFDHRGVTSGSRRKEQALSDEGWGGVVVYAILSLNMALDK